jgi:hypothetical protein
VPKLLINLKTKAELQAASYSIIFTQTPKVQADYDSLLGMLRSDAHTARTRKLPASSVAVPEILWFLIWNLLLSWQRACLPTADIFLSGVFQMELNNIQQEQTDACLKQQARPLMWSELPERMRSVWRDWTDRINVNSGTHCKRQADIAKLALQATTAAQRAIQAANPYHLRRTPPTPFPHPAHLLLAPPTAQHQPPHAHLNPTDALAADWARTLCHQYITFGGCNYGPACRFSHTIPFTPNTPEARAYEQAFAAFQTRRTRAPNPTNHFAPPA